MIKSAKKCLRKAIGRNSLTYNELLALTIEVEAVLNSRLLTYINSEDVVEPLTLLHLLVGFPILTIPDTCMTNAGESDDDDDLSSSVHSVQALTHRMTHLKRSLNNFWRQWKKEEFREHHRTTRGKGHSYDLRKGEIVTIYDEGHPGECGDSVELLICS